MIKTGWALEQNMARDDKYCLNCGKKMYMPVRSQKYCNPDCRDAYLHRAKIEGSKKSTTQRKEAELVTEKYCKGCGKKINYASRWQQYCNPICRERARLDRLKIERNQKEGKVI